MVAILTEPGYGSSVWGKNLYRSLVWQLRQKRIPFCEITETCPEQVETVFLIAANYHWAASAIGQLNRAGHQPILICNQSERIPGCLYSCVCSDINASMKNILELLRAQNKANVALYGVGQTSMADAARTSSLFSWLDGDFSELQVFYNAGSLAACFEAFYPQRHKFDAVLCANDYAAISLVRGLERKDRACLETLTVISCAGTEISGLYRDAITSLPMDFTPYGKAALHVYECIRKNPFISGMTVNITWNPEREICRQAAKLDLPEQEDPFYSDREIRDMLIVDKYLTLREPVDRDIFAALLKGKTYQSIADACFLTEGTVKYRVKRMMQLCGTDNKAEFLELLKIYRGESE